MGESNGAWGDLMSEDAELAALWDDCKPLPEEGKNRVLDTFCKSKNITIPALIRQGCRLQDDTTLAWAYRGGLKYRDLVSGRRWSSFGADWSHALKVVPAGVEPTEDVLVAEGETDGARLSEVYGIDVAILPAGARYFPESYGARLADYERVLVALDNDEAGSEGTAKALELLPNAVHFPPPEDVNDWCELTEDAFPSLTEVEERSAEELLIVDAGTMLELPEPEIVSWYENAILPVGGLMIVHGWAKSFKTFLALDLLGRIAQNDPWAQFAPTEEPAKVLVIQYEIPWAFYRQRVTMMRDHADNPDLFNQNFYTWSPLSRPKLVAGNKKQEDHVIRSALAAGIQVLLLDPVRRATGSIDMNAEAEVRKMLSFFQRLQDEGITVVATHHDNKGAARAHGGDPTDMTGSGAWAGDPDTLVSIELPPGENHRTSVRRNMNFTLRNAPAINSKAFAMDGGWLTYTDEPWGAAEDEDPTAPAI